MTRQAGSFPRLRLQQLIERSLTHKATLTKPTADGQRVQTIMRGFYTCLIDEYRSSVQDSTLNVLLADGRTNKTNPKAGTIAHTTDKNGEPVTFKIHENKKFKLLQRTENDGRIYVSNRDEPTNKNMAATFAADKHGKPRLSNLSRASVPKNRSTQSSARSRTAKDVAASGR